jgi:hypothetical protein
VTITHPHHPLCGQQLPVLRLRRGANPDVIVLLPDGTNAAVALELTDYVTNPEPPSSPSSPTAILLDLDGLRRAAQLIAQLRQEGCFPSAKV